MSETELTDLTIVQGRDGLRARRFTRSRPDNGASLRDRGVEPRLNAYLSVGHAQAMDQARAADAALAQGDTRPLLGIPLAIKDLFCTEGVRTTAGSKILMPFMPPYEMHRHRQPAARRRGVSGQDQYGRVRDGLVQHDLVLRAGGEPVEAAAGRRRGAGAGRIVRRFGGGGGGAVGDGRRQAPIPAARSASRRRFAAWSGSSRPMAAARAGAWWRLPRRWIIRGRLPARCGIAAICWLDGRA